MSSKIHKRSFRDKSSHKIHTDHQKVPSPSGKMKMYVGQYWSMDFGFMRGSSFKTTKIFKGEKVTITRKDGYNSYLIIVERCTRFT